MDRIIFLGTAAGTAVTRYNACFAFAKGDDYMLVDSGGGSELLNRLKATGIPITQIKAVFITHNHIDHIMGLIWLVRQLTKNGPKGSVTIYAQAETIEAIKTLINTVLAIPQIEASKEILEFVTVANGEKAKILGEDFVFYDTKPETEHQFGFKLTTSGKELVFNGDVPLNADNYDLAKNADYLIHEVFGLDSDKSKFSRGGEQFTTTSEICELAETLGVKNLILTHIKDTYGADRKERFAAEGTRYFHGNLSIPDDGDVIQLDI